jgi:cell wall-associated NlpC family hydrolase
MNAPRGALVFYDSVRGQPNLGHVGISLGNGTMINAYGHKGVKIMPIKQSMHYIGWAAPLVTPQIGDWNRPS